MMAREEGPPRPQVEAEVGADREFARRRELARALEAERSSQPPNTPPPVAAPSGGTLWKVAAAATVAVAVAWVGFGGLGRGDSVSDADKAAWAAAWAAAPPQVAHRVAPADVATALDSMGLAPAQRLALQQQLDDGSTRLVYLTFTDVVAEDGDRVRVASDAYATEITIWHETTRVYFPEPASGVVNVTGTFDGGGGITIVITSGETPVNLPFMDVGQTVGIPVVVGS